MNKRIQPIANQKLIPYRDIDKHDCDKILLTSLLEEPIEFGRSETDDARFFRKLRDIAHIATTCTTLYKKTQECCRKIFGMLLHERICECALLSFTVKACYGSLPKRKTEDCVVLWGSGGGQPVIPIENRQMLFDVSGINKPYVAKVLEVFDILMKRNFDQFTLEHLRLFDGFVFQFITYGNRKDDVISLLSLFCPLFTSKQDGDLGFYKESLFLAKAFHKHILEHTEESEVEDYSKHEHWNIFQRIVKDGTRLGENKT